MTHEQHKVKGTLTLPVAVVGSVILTVAAGLASYFGTVNAQDNKISEAKTVINESISQDRQRISTLEEAVKTIKDSQLETRADIKEILRRVK